MCLLGTSEKRILKVFVWKAPRKIGRHARRQMTNGNRKTPSSSANSEDRNENSTVAGKLSEDSPSANWFAATTEDVVASIIRLILEIPKCPAKTIVAVYQRTIITLRSHLDEIGRPLLSLSSILRLIERTFSMTYNSSKDRWMVSILKSWLAAPYAVTHAFLWKFMSRHEHRIDRA